MDFRTSIELDSTEKQLVLASFELGTFYCVYASFTNIENDEYEIEFSIVNYKGPVKIKINDIVEVDKTEGCIHIKIYTSTQKGTDSIKTKLTKGQYLICQRISAKETELSPLLVSEYELPNFTTSFKTPYEIETMEADTYIAQIKEEIKNFVSITSANPKLCIVGNNKLI
ncbi:hypothetical protein [Polaribacter sp. Asnod6-C07]|uniref:hypothetical protein n=1 Tax=Polaribacter sp. Asnod6-C07 TaxID=3160582 RepID=UPI00386ECD0E